MPETYTLDQIDLALAALAQERVRISRLSSEATHLDQTFVEASLAGQVLAEIPDLNLGLIEGRRTSVTRAAQTLRAMRKRLVK